MSHRLIGGALRRMALIAAGGAVFFALVAPFSAGPSALADPRPAPPPAHTYNVTLSCTTSNGQGYLQSGWKWYQGGPSGTVLASGSLTDTCPNAFGGTNSVALSGTQPANADTLFGFLEINLGGCGDFTGNTVSLTPGSPVSLGLSLTAKSPCKYSPNLGDAKVSATFSLQS